MYKSYFLLFSSECIGSRDPYCVWNSTGLSCEESPLSAMDDMTGIVSAEYVYTYWCIPYNTPLRLFWTLMLRCMYLGAYVLQ